MKPELSRRTNYGTERLKLECHTCPETARLLVDSEAPVRRVAKAHGWTLREGYWVCPECGRGEE